RPNRAVREPRRENRLLGRATFPLDKAARNLAGGVHLLLELDRQGKEVNALARLFRGGRGAKQDGVAITHQDCPSGQAGQSPRLQREGPTADFGLASIICHGTPRPTTRRRLLAELAV